MTVDRCQHTSRRAVSDTVPNTHLSVGNSTAGLPFWGMVGTVRAQYGNCNAAEETALRE